MPRRSRLVIVANRLPVKRVRRGAVQTWQTSPGGLVSALKPMLRDTGGWWVGWAGDAGAAPKPFEHDGIHVHPVRLDDEELDLFYHGFSNETLWPLYHDAVRTPKYSRRWWWPYLEINRRFAQNAAEVAGPSDLIWIHDYHLQLVPAMLRELRPKARIGFFLHIPFPPHELFAQLPWRRQILEGLLGADVIGFQTRRGSQNFSRAARQFTEARGTDAMLEVAGRRVQVGDFPISIDVESVAEQASSGGVRARAETLQRELSGPSRGRERRTILLGVDRLDYTKGIDIRLKAFGELLSRGSVSVDEVALVQVAVPSREQVRDYAQMRAEVEHLVGRINGQFSEPGRVAVHYLYRNLGFEELLAHYRAADVMVVTPLRDGMNLVAKEYVATRVDASGVLVLSEFTGAARELKGALLVNPHDVDGLASTLDVATKLPGGEVRRRMAANRRALERNDVYHWADTFLGALAR